MTPQRDILQDVEYRQLVQRLLPDQVRELGLGPTAVLSLPDGAARPSPTARQAYLQWLEREFHGTMGYMARPDRIERRLQYDRVLPGVRSILVTTLFYWPGRSGFPSPIDAVPADRGTVSCYAWGSDYHAILERKLHQLAEWLHGRVGGQGRYYVDTGAVLERDLGWRAGLGFVGKNSMLIHPRLGSGFFLGEILSTLPLPDSMPDTAGKGGCGTCRKCIRACPTGAIVADRVVDARKCISYLTIELKGTIPVALRRPMGSLIYGCDICQRVCPWNAFDWPAEVSHGRSPLFGAVDREQVAEPDLLRIVQMDEAAFRAAYAGTAVERIGCERLRRNAAVALGNQGSAERALPVLRRLVADPRQSALVREHAQWAVEELEWRHGRGGREANMS